MSKHIAEEVRAWADQAGSDKFDMPECSEMLRAYATLLAAQEKAEPVARFGGRRITPCGTREFWGTLCLEETDLQKGTLLYTHPPAQEKAEPVACNPANYCAANHMKLYAHPPAQAWMPIESAPRGTENEFLGFSDGLIDKTWEGWNEGDKPVYVRADWVSWEPTLWQPLPPSPKGK